MDTYKDMDKNTDKSLDRKRRKAKTKTNAWTGIEAGTSVEIWTRMRTKGLGFVSLRTLRETKHKDNGLGKREA